MLQAGAQYLRRAYWGCEAGVHTSWLVVEAESDEDARLIAPPAFRASSVVVPVETFTPERIRRVHAELPSQAAASLELAAPSVVARAS
jgi:hypothetical protein